MASTNQSLKRVADKLKAVLGDDLSIVSRGGYVEISLGGQVSKFQSQKRVPRAGVQVRDR